MMIVLLPWIAELSLADQENKGKEVMGFLERSTDIVLVTTSTEIEEKFIDIYHLLSDKNIVLVGS